MLIRLFTCTRGKQMTESNITQRQVRFKRLPFVVVATMVFASKEKRMWSCGEERKVR